MRSQPVKSTEVLHHEGYASYAFITPPQYETHNLDLKLISITE
jgi:hypothetical protein